MNDVIVYMVSCLFFLLVMFFLINFLTNGFLFTYFLVKASRGKYILVRVFGMTSTFYRVGKPYEDTNIKFKGIDNKSEKTLVGVAPSSIYRTLGVNSIDLDDKNSIRNPTGTVIKNDNPQEVSDLLVRAINKPNIKDTKQQIKIILILLVMGGALLFIIFNLIELKDLVTALTSVGVVQ